MKRALPLSKITTVYNRTASYYDWLHGWGTFKLDQRGRDFLVRRAISGGERILDAGGGTGTTGLAALKGAGHDAELTILDVSEGMLNVAQRKAEKAGLSDRVKILVGDMYAIPFPDEHFDVVLSSYSTCPLANPGDAAREMVRVTRIGGKIGIGHSCEPNSKIARAFSHCIESIIWRFPRLSMGCRNIDLTDAIDTCDVEVTDEKVIGFPPWYFRLLVMTRTGSKSNVEENGKKP